MRHILYSVLVVALIGSSCQKKVTDIVPQDLISSDIAFTTPAKIEAAVLAGYDGLQSAEFLAGRALVYVDVMGEDIFDRRSYFGDLPSFNMLSNASIPYKVWTAGYNAIARANTAIAGINVNPTVVTADEMKAYIA